MVIVWRRANTFFAFLSQLYTTSHHKAHGSCGWCLPKTIIESIYPWSSLELPQPVTSVFPIEQHKSFLSTLDYHAVLHANRTLQEARRNRLSWDHIRWQQHSTSFLGEDMLHETWVHCTTYHSSFHWVEGGWGFGHDGGWGSARAARRAPAAHWQQLHSEGWGPPKATPAQAHHHFRQPLLRPAHFQQWRKGAGTPHRRNPLWLSWWQPARQTR